VVYDEAVTLEVLYNNISIKGQIYWAKFTETDDVNTVIIYTSTAKNVVCRPVTR
jgi:hypothetical protein